MSAKVVATLPGAVKKIESEGGLVHSGRALFLFSVLLLIPRGGFKRRKRFSSRLRGGPPAFLHSVDAFQEKI